MANRKHKIQVPKGLSMKLERELTDLANEVGVRVKPIVRDELERTYRNNIYASYDRSGTYHHTGILAQNAYAVIEDNAVVAKIREARYPDKKRRKITTYQVYEWLTEGTTDNPKSEYYPLEENRKGTRRYTRTLKNGEKRKDTIHWAKYEPTSIHTFEQDTIDDMETYINTELIPALTNKKGYLYEQIIQRYIDKRSDKW